MIAYKPEGVSPNFEAYAKAFKTNDDGAGFVVAYKGELVIQKGFFRFDDFVGAFEPYADHQALIHFRIRTHGEANVANCHPFDVGGVHNNKDFAGKVAVVHNGVIIGQKCYNAKMSDTWHFVKDELYPLFKKDRKFFTRPHVIQGIREKITSDKMAFLDADGICTILNQEAGNWDGGHWYSNYSWKDYGGSYDSGWQSRSHWVECADKVWRTEEAILNLSREGKVITAEGIVYRGWASEDHDDGNFFPLVKTDEASIAEADADNYATLCDELLSMGVPLETIHRVYKARGMAGLNEMCIEHFIEVC